MQIHSRADSPAYLPADRSVIPYHIPWSEYRLQAEVVQGLQPRSHAPFFQRKKGFAGLKALVDFRLKPVLRRDCGTHAETVPPVAHRPTTKTARYGGGWVAAAITTPFTLLDHTTESYDQPAG